MVEKFNCPVCGEIVEGKKGEHEICGKCRWEDDPYQGKHPDYKGGANKMSLNQAREAFKKGIPIQ